MALDAGSVMATLGGRVDMRGFVAYGEALNVAQAKAAAAERRMAEFQRRSEASMRRLGLVAKYTAIGVGVGLVGALGYAVKKAADFESQISSLAAVSGASAKQLDALRKQAMAAGAATKYSALESAQAQTELAKGGLSVQKILSGGLKGALALAAAGELDLAQAAATTANALNLFGLGGGQATHVADALASAANATTADVGDFAIALSQGGAAAKAAGLSFDQTIVALEALAKSGVKGSDAGTSLKASLAKVVQVAKNGKGEAQQLAQAFFDSSGKIKTTAQLAGLLRTAFGDLTQQQRLTLAQQVAGTDGFRTLLALYDRGPETLRRYLAQVREQGTAVETAAKKQDNLKGKLENLGGSIETAAIKVGQKLLPSLEKAASAATRFINQLAASGKLDQFAAGAEQALRVTGAVLLDIGRAGADTARAIADVVRAFADLAGVSDATAIEAILAAFLGFKAVSFLAPMLVTIGQAMRELVMNARTAPTIAAFFRSLSAGTAIGLAATAIGGLVGAIVLLGGRESIETQLARENAEAHKRQAEAIKSVMEAERAAADQGLAAKQAKLDLKKASLELARVQRDEHSTALDREQALLNQQQAALRVVTSTDLATKSIREQDAAVKKATSGSLADLQKAQQRLVELDERRLAALRAGGGRAGNPAVLPGAAGEHDRARARAVANITDLTQRYVQALARAQVSDESRQRLMKRSTQITQENAVGISQLIAALRDVPATVKSKLLLQDQDALAKAGGYAALLRTKVPQQVITRLVNNAQSAGSLVLAFKAILDGVPRQKVVKVLSETKTARGELAALRREIEALHDKTVTITTNLNTVYGGAPRGGGGARRPQGQARGTKTRGPQLAWIGEGSDPVEWVIPRDARYRGRAVELLMDAARSILPGHDKGHKHGAPVRRSRPRPAHVGGVAVTRPGSVKRALNLPIPAKIAEGGVPFEDVARDRERLHGEYAQASRGVEGARKRLAAAQHRLDRVPNGARYDRSRSNAKDAVAQARKQLAAAKAKQARLKPMALYADRLWRAARQTSTRSEQLQSEINLQASYMGDADRAGDRGAYTQARAARKRSTRQLIVLLQRALRLANPNSEYARRLREQLAALGGKPAVDGVSPTAANQAAFGGDLGDPELSGAETQLPPAPETFTDEEKKTLSDLNSKVALAALTSGLEDDRSAAGGLASFLQGVLDQALSDPAKRGGSDAITEIAGQLKQAKDNLASLTGGTQSNENPDLQAQIDQATRQRDIAREEARINAAALAVLGGPGDIGTGGQTARGTVVNQQFNMLHPGDPKLLRAIGDAATAGIALQPARSSPRERLGV